jgi:hypothetical protein
MNKYHSLVLLYNSTKNEYLKEVLINENIFSTDEWTCIEEGKVNIGMSELSVLASIGSPIDTKTEYKIDEETYMNIKFVHDIHQITDNSLLHIFYKNDNVFLIVDELKNIEEYKQKIWFLKENLNA